MKRMFAILLAFLVLVQSTWVLAADFSDGTGDDTFTSGSEDMITEPSEEEIFSEPDMSSEDETSEDNFSTSDEEENETQSAQNDQEQEITADSESDYQTGGNTPNDSVGISFLCRTGRDLYPQLLNPLFVISLHLVVSIYRISQKRVFHRLFFQPMCFFSFAESLYVVR